VPNGQRHNLETFPDHPPKGNAGKTCTGIIFDEHMLKQKVGLDIDTNPAAPKPLSSDTHHLAKPDGIKLQGSSLLRLLVTIISVLGFPLLCLLAVIVSVLGSPFRWIWSKLPQLLSHHPPNDSFKGEAQEELDDRLCPIYDQLDEHIYWKVMEWIPCKLPLPQLIHTSSNELIRHLRDRKKAERRGGRFGLHLGLQVCVSPSFHDLSPTAGSVTDYVGCQLEPAWKRPKSVSPD
jgi:hypothetical protein